MPQHGTNNQWLDRQRQKLLPVDYYLVTFTLPAQLRGLVWHHQRRLYHALFSVAQATLNQFAGNDRRIGSDLGLVGVLHTHSRRLAFHPHVHFVVPGEPCNGCNCSCAHHYPRRCPPKSARQDSVPAAVRP